MNNPNLSRYVLRSMYVYHTCALICISYVLSLDKGRMLKDVAITADQFAQFLFAKLIMRSLLVTGQHKFSTLFCARRARVCLLLLTQRQFENSVTTIDTTIGYFQNFPKKTIRIHPESEFGSNYCNSGLRSRCDIYHTSAPRTSNVL